jgi:hypothetical protein
VGTALAVVVLICLSIVAVTRVRSNGVDGETVASGGTATSQAVTVPETSLGLVPDAAVVEAPPASETPTIPSTTTTTAPRQTKKEKSNDRTAPFSGMGAWVDVFEWAPSYVSPSKTVILPPTAVDRMADEGVQVLYLQASRFNNPTGGDIVDPDVLAQWIERAQANDITVVAWYLPTLTDPEADLRRIKAIGKLPGIAGLGIDIESTAVKDPAVRSARMVELSKAVRAAFPDRPISGIVLPAVDTDVVNLNYWPGFPWQQIKGIYDVWQPMGYWTNRTTKSGYRDAERYTRENVERLRAHLGDPKAVVHPIGGIMNKATPADVAGYLKAVRETGCIGASLYNWSTQKPETYALMRGARS